MEARPDDSFEERALEIFMEKVWHLAELFRGSTEVTLDHYERLRRGMVPLPCFCNSNGVSVCDIIAKNELLHGRSEPGFENEEEDISSSETRSASHAGDKPQASFSAVTCETSSQTASIDESILGYSLFVSPTEQPADQPAAQPTDEPPHGTAQLPVPNHQLAKPSEAEYDAVKDKIWRVLVSYQTQTILTGAQIKAEV